MKPRAEIEARMWSITGRMLNPPMIDQVVELIEECADARIRDMEARRARAREKQARFDADMQYLIHLLAQMMDEADPRVYPACDVCHKAVSPQARHCKYCGCALATPAADPDGTEAAAIPLAGAA